MDEYENNVIPTEEPGSRPVDADSQQQPVQQQPTQSVSGYNSYTYQNSYQNNGYNQSFNGGYAYPQQQYQQPKKKNGAAVAVIAAICAGIVCFGLGVLITNGMSSINAGYTDVNSRQTQSQTQNTASGTATQSREDDYAFETASSGETYPITEIAAKTMDSVVEITTETISRDSFMRQYVTSGAGSGVIVREDGLIVTNNHVIEGATAITVRLRSGEEYEATLIGTDEESDIAVVRIDATGLPAAVIGDSSSLRVGDVVVAIGNPLGSLGGTVTDGIISALERQITIDGQTMTLLQTNAAINPGNSGGGLFNASGELIGVVNAKSSGSDIEGLGFAIPINTAKAVMEDLINYGYVRGRTMLGVTMLDIYSDSYVRYYGVPGQGTYISSVADGSDAQKAGLKSADMIISLNGSAVTSSKDVTDILHQSSVGDTLTFEIERIVSSNRWTGKYETETLSVTVTLTEYRSNPSLVG